MNRKQSFITCGIILFVLVLIASWATPAISASQPPTPSTALRVFEFPLDSGCINTFLTTDAIVVRVAAAQALEDKRPEGCYPEPVVRVLAPPPVVPNPCADAKTFSVYFDFDKSGVRDDFEKGTIKNAAEWINKCAGDVEVILSEGNCDNRGTNDYNMALGARRAESVAGMLEYFNVDTSKIKITSFGEENAGGTDHQEDRRVDIVVQPK